MNQHILALEVTVESHIANYRQVRGDFLPSLKDCLVPDLRFELRTKSF
jgi:hypothetical protein